MFGPGGTVTGADVLANSYVHMGQASSIAVEPPDARKASSTVLRQEAPEFDDESEHQPFPCSRPDSWSMHYDCTNQAPYTTMIKDDKMMTQNSILQLPRGNASHDLAFFLRTTGPTAPHRRPSKVDQSRRTISAPKNALRFLKLGAKRQIPQVQSAHERLNGVLRDEGGLLADTPEHPVPNGVEQKLSSTGKRYLALQIPSSSGNPDTEDTPILKLGILDSRVSVCFPEEALPQDSLDDWPPNFSKPHVQRGGPSLVEQSPHEISTEESMAMWLTRRFPTPVRPSASEPPSPVPESAVSMANSYQSDLPEHPAKVSFEATSASEWLKNSPSDRSLSPKGVSRVSLDLPRPLVVAARTSLDSTRALSSHPVGATALGTPKISLPDEEFPVKHPSPGKEVEIKHPSPRRFASHPVLLQRASSIASSYQRPRTSTDSPGPPPPRSPLRLKRDPQAIENVLANLNGIGKVTPKMAPSIKPVSEYNYNPESMRATVTTECSGPIKRPISREKENRLTVLHPAYPNSRKEREARVRARKLRDRPTVNRTIDAVVSETVPNARQRLRKIRPHIQIPDLRPAPLRAPSAASAASASSAASWKKVTESTLVPISPVPSQRSQDSKDEKTGYTPVTPTESNKATEEDTAVKLTPVMLVAEEVPVPRTKSTPKPTRIVVKEGRSYAPRPRSASIPRAVQRRSRTSVHASPCTTSPDMQHSEEEEMPPLPSPPPTRALPPTPPASGSEKQDKNRSFEGSKHLLHSPMFNIVSKSSAPLKRSAPIPHVISQAQRKSSAKSRIEARLEQLEKHNEQLDKQNALLSAALMAVLKTNGALNAPLAGVKEAERPKTPMAWESRIARRSAASHTASSSNGSALEMYMSTRRGSRRGC